MEPIESLRCWRSRRRLARWGGLDDAGRAALAGHAAGCARCAAELEAMERLETRLDAAAASYRALRYEGATPDFVIEPATSTRVATAAGRWRPALAVAATAVLALALALLAPFRDQPRDPRPSDPGPRTTTPVDGREPAVDGREPAVETGPRGRTPGLRSAATRAALDALRRESRALARPPAPKMPGGFSFHAPRRPRPDAAARDETTRPTGPDAGARGDG